MEMTSQINVINTGKNPIRNRMIFRLNIIVMCCFFSGSCANYFKPPPDTITLWEKKGVTIEDKAKYMKKCGYPSTTGSGRTNDFNKIAIMQICMENHGFSYNKRFKTFCESYPDLPACIEARAEKEKLLKKK